MHEREKERERARVCERQRKRGCGGGAQWFGVVISQRGMPQEVLTEGYRTKSKPQRKRTLLECRKLNANALAQRKLLR